MQSQELFLSRIGPKIGAGFQGQVHEYGKDVVKILPRSRRGQNLDSMIYTEIVNGMYAADIGAGPQIREFRFIQDKAYIIMERVKPVILRQSDMDRLVELFRKLISIGLVNLDGSFGETSRGKLVMFDYGVSHVETTPHKAVKMYLDNDYFYSFQDFHHVKGLEQYFNNKKK